MILAKRVERFSGAALAAITLSGFIACSDSKTDSPEPVTTTQSALSGGTDPVVRYWFNESSGTQASDSSGNGHTATLENGATFVAGARGNAVRINGGSQRVVLPAGVVERCEDLTIAARVNLASNSANWARIFDFGSSTTSYMFLTPRAGASNVLRFGITTGGGAAEQQISHTFTFPTNTWKHIAVVLSGNTGTMYLDGVQVAQNTNLTRNPSELGTTTNNWLGDSQFAADPTLNGTIDDVVVSCRPYSASEVAWLASGSDPVAKYTFNETSGTTAQDSSGNARHATLVSGASFVSGLHGNAVQIAGGSQRVTLPNAIVQSCNDLTIAAHVRLASNLSNWARIFDFGSNSTSYMFLTPRAGASNALRFAITNSGQAGEQQLSHTFSFPTNTWKHVAVVLSGNTGRMYLDGVQVAQNTSLTRNPSELGATTNNSLGDSQFAADPTLNGTIDNLLISCRAFSAAEIDGLADACATAADCNDGNACTTDTCNSGFCTHSAVSNGTACPDGNLCNGGETCQSGACSPGTPPVVDDGNACTTDACDPVQGVTHTPITGCGAGGAGGAGGTSGAGGGGTGGGGGATCPTGTTAVEMFIELPPNTSRASIALGSYGATPLEVHDRVRVLAPGGTTFSSVSSLSTNPAVPTQLGVEAHVHHIYAEPNLELRDRSRVHGNAVSPGTITFLPGASVDGQPSQRELTPRRRESWIVCHPNSHQGNIDVQPGQVFPTNGTRLATGAWGTFSVKAGARIRLRGASTYFFENIAIEPGAIFDLDTAAGGIQLYFRNGGYFRGVQERTDARPNVLFGAENGAFTINGSFRGTVVAPRGLVELPTAAGGHQGSFYGAPVIVRPDANVTHEPPDTTGMCAPGVCNGLCPCGGGAGGSGGVCNSDADCGSGLICGQNNGACFGAARVERRCWPAQCLDGIDPVMGECGTANSPCGPVCGCAKPCKPDDPANNCPPGEECVPNFGRAVGLHSYGILTPDACGPGGGVCPSDDPTLCGDASKLCGSNCIGSRNCLLATPQNPRDGSGRLCPGVCPIGLKGCCTHDLECANGGACLMDPDGALTCRPRDPCANQPLKPPLCGAPNSVCGPECPICIPRCEGRACGTDPNCGESCGSCPSGQHCDAAGQCRVPTSDTPISVPDGNGGQRDVDDLPPTPAAGVGAVPGQFSVTDQGTAQYTIPIEVPPGRLGMAPSLALVYQATRENGAVGVGWRIEGLSKVTRCPKNFALDGYAAAVKNDSTDPLCLDGKRLVAVANAEAQGGNGTEYRTLIDSFAKIISRQDADVQLDQAPPGGRKQRRDQGPDSFEVRTKDGRIMTYGGTIDTLVMRTDGVRQSWLLRKIEDRTGNSIIYTYESSASNVLAPDATGRIPTRFRPNVISYTGRGDTPGNREVRFTYDTRPDPTLRYLQGGIAWTLRDRLTQITTYVEGETPPNPKPVKNYRLEYVLSDFSQVQKITECEGDLNVRCKPATQFNYSPFHGFSGPPLPEGGIVAPANGGELDLNGDGFPDFLATIVDVDVPGSDSDPALVAAQIGTDIGVDLATSPANLIVPGLGFALSSIWRARGADAFWGWVAPQPEVTITITDHVHINSGVRNTPSAITGSSLPCFFTNSFLDYNRDGRDDVMVQCGQGTQHGGQARLSDGTGAFSGIGGGVSINILPRTTHRINEQGSQVPVEDIQYPRFGPNPVFFDIDGDSLEDVVYCRDECTIELRRRLSASANFDDSPIRLPSSTCVIDCNSETCVLEGEVEPFCAIERKKVGEQALNSEMRNPERSMGIFDHDGDGTPELIHSYKDANGTARWRALRYTGPVAAARLQWQNVEFPNVDLSQNGGGIKLADLNSDGLTDVYGEGPVDLRIWLNTGGGAFILRRVPRPSQEGFTFRRSALADYNADGRFDLIESWKRSVAPCLEQHRIAVLHLNSDQSAFSTATIDPDDLKMRGQDSCDLLEPIGFDLFVDLDADGAGDFLSSGEGFYGNSPHRLLLSSVVDGLGNRVDVHYDAPGTYTKTCSGASGSTYPETCLKRMTGLVSSHTEGFSTSNANSPQVERTYTYNYENARVSTTGHGWLGFERRTVRETVNLPPAGMPADTEPGGGTTTIEMEPIKRYSMSGAPIESTVPPYIYPFAGLPKTITADQMKAQTPLESASYRRRTLVENVWQIGLSASNRPFPEVRTRTTEVFEASGPNSPANGALLTRCTEELETDRYGNVTDHNETCRDSSTHTVTSFVPNESTWLISNPQFITIISDGPGSAEQVQLWDPEYDANGLLFSITRSPGGPGPAAHTTVYGRNAFGNIETITESVTSGEPARQTVIDYDTDEVFPRVITNPKGQITEVIFDERWGTPKTVTDPNYIVVQHSYDGLGLLAETRDPEGVTIYDYAMIHFNGMDPTPGLPPLVGSGIEVMVSRQGVNGTPGGITSTWLDALGRTVRTLEQGLVADLVEQHSRYDARGRLAFAELPHKTGSTSEAVPTVTYSYDAFNRLKRVTHADGEFAEIHHASPVTLAPQFDHWLDGLECEEASVNCPVEIERSIDEEGARDLVIREQRGQVIRNIDGEHIDLPEGAMRASDYVYGAFSRLRRMRHNALLSDPSNAPLTLFSPDPYGRLITHTDPDSGTTTYSYNGFDELKTSIDPKNQLRTFNYDDLGRTTSIIDPAGTTQWIYDQGVNAIGRLVESISPATPEAPLGQHLVYSYEPYNANNNRGLLRRLDYVIDSTVYPLEFTHDDLGRTETIRYPNLGSGPPIVAKYFYNHAGILTAVDEIGNGIPQPVWQVFTAFQGHLIEHERFGNGTRTTYGYDNDRRFLETITTTFQEQTIQDLSYTHYANGQVRERIKNQTDTRAHVYDALNRLWTTTHTETPAAPATATVYGYDHLGNMTQRGATTLTYLPSKPHVLNSVGANAYQHDANGNVTQRTGPDIPDAIQTIAYTPFDLPKTILTGQTGVTKTTRFEYSADEERLVRRDTASGVNKVRHFVTDLYQRHVDNNSGTTTEERFRLYAGSREIAQIVRQNGVDETLYFHTDNLGTPQTITTDDGEITTLEFDEFGVEIAPSSTELTRVGFTGHEHDREIGFVDMKGRVYDPLAARFTTQDPIMQAPFWSQGLNRYAYVFNDPVNNTDPSGMMVDSAGSGAGIMMGGLMVGGLGSVGFQGMGGVGPGGLGLSIGFTLGNLLTGMPGMTSTGPRQFSGTGPGGTRVPTSVPGRSGIDAASNNDGRVGPLRPLCETFTCLAQNAGDPSTGTRGRSGSTSDVSKSNSALELADKFSTVLPGAGAGKTAGKAAPGVIRTIWNWIKSKLGFADDAAAKAAPQAAQAAPKLFSAAETEGLKKLFGTELRGAEQAMKRVSQGSRELPSGVTRETLGRYRQQILDKGLQDIPVQKERLRIIEELLK